MKRTPLRRRAPLRAKTKLRRSKPLERADSMAATDAQRAAVAGCCCIVCGCDRRIDPAHLIPRSVGGCGHPLCVVPVCRAHHRAYDRGQLDLLPYLYLQKVIIRSPLMWSRFSLLIWDARWVLLRIIRPADGAAYGPSADPDRCCRSAACLARRRQRSP